MNEVDYIIYLDELYYDGFAHILKLENPDGYWFGFTRYLEMYGQQVA
jgi:hypothetical protein